MLYLLYSKTIRFNIKSNLVVSLKFYTKKEYIRKLDDYPKKNIIAYKITIFYLLK